MKIKKISWIDSNFDMESDGEPVLIEQDWGNKGLGGIVFALCLLAVLLPSIPIILQISKGTAKGNPLGGLIALYVIFSWPLYWGLNQFFLKRHVFIDKKFVKFELITIFRRKKYEVKIKDYGQIEFGKTETRSSIYGGPGRTGEYFVRLPHKDRKSAVVLYENIQELLSIERLKNYSRKLNLSLVNITPDKFRKDAEFNKKLESIIAERKTRSQSDN